MTLVTGGLGRVTRETVLGDQIVSHVQNLTPEIFATIESSWFLAQLGNSGVEIMAVAGTAQIITAALPALDILKSTDLYGLVEDLGPGA